MQIALRDNLPFIQLTITHLGQRRRTEVLIDTGSAATVFDTDLMETIGLRWTGGDMIRTMRGIGGVECAAVRTVDRIDVGTRRLNHCSIQVTAMDYGRFDIQGIVGMDLLRPLGAIIDLAQLELRFAA